MSHPDAVASPHDEEMRERGLYALPEHKQRDFGAMMQAVHQQALNAGWWEGADSDSEDGGPTVAMIAEKLLMIHSEISEATEELRDDRLALWWRDMGEGKHEKPEGMVVELADAVIRIFDLCAFLGLDLLGCIRLKSAYNDTRGHRHGGKAL